MGVIVAGIIAGVAVAAIWAWRADDRPTSVAARRGLAGFVAAGALLVSPETGDVSGGEAGGAIAWLAGAAAAKAVATAAGCDATGCAPDDARFGVRPDGVRPDGVRPAEGWAAATVAVEVGLDEDEASDDASKTAAGDAPWGVGGAGAPTAGPICAAASRGAAAADSSSGESVCPGGADVVAGWGDGAPVAESPAPSAGG